MKILHILYELKFSGAEIMYVDAAPLFQHKGCELSVLATGPNLGEYAPYFKNAGYTVFHIPIPSLANYHKRLIFYWKLNRLIKKEKFDVIHIHNAGAMWGASLCAKINNIKAVFTFHNVYPSKFYSYWYHCLIRWSAKRLFNCCFHTISDSVFDHELKYYHNKTTKIYNWFGDKRFYPGTIDEKKNIRNELGIEESTFVLISIGGCSHIKRHSDIIKALPLIKQNIPNILYIHLGKGVTESEEVELAKTIGVTDLIRFYGNQVDVRKFLIASDVYLMPSKFEGIPITTIEALGCGIPSILYNVPGLKDFNNTGENCVLIPEDYKILAEKVLFLHENPQYALKLAEQALTLVNNKFNININANKIFELYK